MTRPVAIDATQAVLEQVADRLVDVINRVDGWDGGRLRSDELVPLRTDLLELYAVVAELALDRRDAACYSVMCNLVGGAAPEVT